MATVAIAFSEKAQLAMHQQQSELWIIASDWQ
jgi:hypothetical protein